MKKIFLVLLLGFLFNGNANAITKLKGIYEVDLLVESLSKYAEECSISYEKIETTAKYVLANSKIKISEENYNPFLYIRVVVLNNGDTCSVYSKLTVQTAFAEDPYKQGNRGSYIFYQDDRIASGGINSNIADFVISSIEEMLKEFVVKHHEDNQ